MLKLKVLGNQGIYKGTFAKPIFDVLGPPTPVRRSLYDAFRNLQFLISVQDLRFEYNAPLNEQYIGVQFQRGHLKVQVERFEINLIDFTPQDLALLPQYFKAADNFSLGLDPNLKYSDHEFSYYAHVATEGARAVDFLSGLPSPPIKTGGVSLGCGFNFLWELPEQKVAVPPCA